MCPTLASVTLRFSRQLQEWYRTDLPNSAVACREHIVQVQRVCRADFMRQTGYPRGRKGYVVDHIIPPECGGADDPSNVLLQSHSSPVILHSLLARNRPTVSAHNFSDPFGLENPSSGDTTGISRMRT
jgi:hypothetical protein